jgi:hypothetical protein
MAPDLDESVVRLAAILRQTASQADDLIAAVRREGGERYGTAVRRLERQLKRTNADLQDLEQEAARRSGRYASRRSGGARTSVRDGGHQRLRGFRARYAAGVSALEEMTCHRKRQRHALRRHR